MKALVCRKYGLPEDFELEEMPKPVPIDNQVLVEVHASSVTTQNLCLMRGRPIFIRMMGSGLFKPKQRILGNDVAGRIASVGANVKKFKPGDEVFGDLSPCGYGAFAEFVCVPEDALALKPANLAFNEAAAVPEAALVALQGLRDKGRIQKGKKVLIYGASGGIGSFAVQMAKYFGAEVTGVCGTRNLAMVRSLGADHVIDYTKDDYTRNGPCYDLIFAIAYRSIYAHGRALNPQGIYVSTGSPSMARIFQDVLIGPRISKIGGQTFAGGWSAKPNNGDLIFVKELIEGGKVKPVIDRCYPLSEAAKAFRYYAEGHSKGKVVIAVEHKR